ncbi:hypothetical protein CC85DRAFT_284813 [Cutaneotrichosporon oleaginosum]|uniref:RRM domain-containing protein n=1 Tax=Cutaneotrichosporon oleaginosum TaxID=879819 RepID=A0A0J1B6A9_9TREE|nr:uncharacterized protein CC85DRAFT_284813 [Cutaneotrichosporon oleaginosum]KLT43259.1 hypothetical protein CC85DRAFT_284813 [Cutaneotrichosporon oleaginosum]TXT09937.1 hypothetical protein COLE_03871 [Cutaneotrichosporon oleaginosum]
MSGGYNRGGYTPQQRYTSTAPTFDTPSFRPPMPPAGLPPFPPRNFPTPPVPPMPPASFRSPYEDYNASYTPPQSKTSQPGEAYDPYDPLAPALRSTPQTMSYSGQQARSRSPSGSSFRGPSRAGDFQELSLLTSPTTLTIGDLTTSVYSLPPSHLPITKYATVNPGDAIDLHRAICQSGMTHAVWYADGQTRGGEGWGGAVEWVLETSMSGSKLRTCAGQNDALGAELTAINKAVEGFRDHLHQSIKTQNPMSHEFVLFVSSVAALVSIDTSSRPESLQFCKLWREICTEFLKAHLTIVHLPKGSDVEGYILAEKIAKVAATNSFARRKKERTLDEFYNRPGGGDPAPGGSTEAGAWQRGDADPSRRKSPFERPKPLSNMSPERLSPALPPALDASTGRKTTPPPRGNSHDAPSRRRSLSRDIPSPHSPREDARSSQLEGGEDDIQPRRDELLITNFPAHACAKDLGMLFVQHGDITSVDIFSVGPGLPRFAFVAYADLGDRFKAIEAFHKRPIDLDSPFARENAAELEVWKGWNGTLTVVHSDPERLVPLSIARDYPNLPPYATQRRVKTSAFKREHDHEAAETTPPMKKLRAGSDSADQSSLPPTRPSGTPSRPGFDASDPMPPRPTNRSEPTHQVTPPLTSASASASLTPDDGWVKISGKTLQAQIDLVQNVFVKHDRDNWIAHTCLIATDLDQVRRSLQADLYATDEAAILCRDLESKLSARGFTLARMDTVVSRVLKVLDNMAAEDEAENGGPPPQQELDSSRLQDELTHVLRDYPRETREAMASAATVLEYLNRGKDAQEAKRLEAERRAGVLEGMVQKGEQVTGVVKFLLSG